jgi:hypothetical protein
MYQAVRNARPVSIGAIVRSTPELEESRMSEPTEPTPPEPDNGAGATEADEEAVLQELYGAPDTDGIYRGEEQ